MMNILEEAIIYATIMHQGKVRKFKGVPFILHPLEVAQILSTMTDDEDVIERICLRVPERLHYAVGDFVRRENRDILLVEGIEDLLADLKMAGYKVFLLSNTSSGFHRFWPKVGVNK